MQRGPREVAYSYLCIKEWIKVSSLSKRERETVLNSRIIKDSHCESYYIGVTFPELSKYSTDAALKGLLIAV
jgi:hypothetical protein